MEFPDFSEIDKIEAAWLEALNRYDKEPTIRNHLVEDKAYEDYCEAKDERGICEASGCRTFSPRDRLCLEHRDDPKVIS